MNPSPADPGSLDRLHDIVLPAPAPWWPPAPAWYVLGGLLAIFLITLSWALFAWWQRNAYRREALAELAELEPKASQAETLAAVAELVKRVALAVYPRDRVASLTGDSWLSFLDASAGTSDFQRGAGANLESAYSPSNHPASPELFHAVRHWIKHHRADLA
jgi:hypothetical protein